MEKKIQNLLDKYEPKPLNSLKLENNILDIEKDIIFEKESQIPNFVLNSNCPFDKNYCFYDISLTVSTKENIFPKEKYFLKSQQIVELKPVDINKIFDDDITFKNDTTNSPNEKREEKEDIKDDEVQKKIISSIENHNYKSYIPKNLEKNNNINPNEVINEWYIIGNNTKEGPFNDFTMYNKLYQIYYDATSKKEKLPNYLINEKKTDIFMTMDDCFSRLKTKYEYPKQTTPSANTQYLNQVKMLYMNNMKMLNYYYQMNILNNMNNINQRNKINIQNNNKNNKNNVPNKFDNSNNKQKIRNPNTTANNKFNNNNKNNNKNIQRKNDNRNNNNKSNNNNNMNNRWNNNNCNNKGKNQYNNGNNGRYHKNNNYQQHYQMNKYNKKEKRIDKDYKKKDNSLQNKNGKGFEQKKNEALNKKEENNRENNVNEDNKEEIKMTKVENVEKWFFEKE